MRVARTFFSSRWLSCPCRRGRDDSARRPAQDAGGLEVAARRAGGDVASRQDGGGPVVVRRDAARMARHDGPRRRGLSPGLSRQRPVHRRKRAVPVPRFERRRVSASLSAASRSAIRSRRPTRHCCCARTGRPRSCGAPAARRRPSPTGPPSMGSNPTAAKTPRSTPSASRPTRRPDLPGRRHEGGGNPTRRSRRRRPFRPPHRPRASTSTSSGWTSRSSWRRPGCQAEALGPDPSFVPPLVTGVGPRWHRYRATGRRNC